MDYRSRMMQEYSVSRISVFCATILAPDMLPDVGSGLVDATLDVSKSEAVMPVGHPKLDFRNVASSGM
jgi:hypothetical protein